MPAQRRLTDYNQAQTEAALRKYMRGYFGAPLYDQQQLESLERALCVDAHRGCHLYYATGDDTPEKLKGYVAAQRRNALKQMELNRAAYEADAVRHRTSIRRLTARIRNAMLAYLQPTPVLSLIHIFGGGGRPEAVSQGPREADGQEPRRRRVGGPGRHRRMRRRPV